MPYDWLNPYDSVIAYDVGNTQSVAITAIVTSETFPTFTLTLPTVFVSLTGIPTFSTQWSLVQSPNAVQSGTNSPNVFTAFPNANALGNLLLAVVAWNIAGQNVTVLDSSNGSWLLLGTQIDPSNSVVTSAYYVPYCKAAGPLTVTAKFGANVNFPCLVISEFSGGSGGAPDTSSLSTALSGATVTGGQLNPSIPGELIFFGFNSSGNTSYTMTGGLTFLKGVGGLGAAYILSGNQGPYIPTVTRNTNASWETVDASFTPNVNQISELSINAPASVTLSAISSQQSFGLLTVNSPVAVSLIRIPSAESFGSLQAVQDYPALFIHGVTNDIVASSASNSLTIVNTAGSALVIGLGYQVTSSPSISDSNGNTYQLLANYTNTDWGGYTLALYLALNVKQGNNIITATFSPASTWTQLSVAEYWNVIALDSIANTNHAFNTRTVLSAPVTVHNPNGLIVNYVGTVRPVSVGILDPFPPLQERLTSPSETISMGDANVAQGSYVVSWDTVDITIWTSIAASLVTGSSSAPPEEAIRVL